MTTNKRTLPNHQQATYNESGASSGSTESSAEQSSLWDRSLAEVLVNPKSKRSDIIVNQIDLRDALIAQLRRENRYLRSKLGDKPIGLQHVNTTGRILRRAYDDALSLLALHDANYTVTRAFARELGISERRYYWAIGLLRSAGVLRRHQWRSTDYLTGSQKLETRYHELRERADALPLLRLYLPRKMDYTYK